MQKKLKNRIDSKNLNLISIVIPVYNGSNYMKEAIESALNQTYKNIEVIVVNDGSTDNTEEIALSYGNKIRYFKKENGGVATALNLAIKEAKGEYISWLSHDDVYYPNKIQAQIDVLNELDDKNTILYSNYELIDEKSNIKDEIHIEAAHYNYKLSIPLYPILKGLIHGCSLLIPKICFNEIGLFDERLKCTQDYDLWFRMFPKYKIKFIDKILIKSRVHPEQDSKKQLNNVPECDKLWIKFANETNFRDKLLISGSPRAFLQDLEKLTFSANYLGANKYIIKKLKEYSSLGKKQYKVSVIIPFYNRIEKVKKALLSAIEQTYNNIEIILVNDGSEDDLSQIENIIKRDKRIILLNLQNNMGPAYARNFGIKKANGDFIAFLDSDDEWELNKIECQLNFMLKNDYYASHTSYKIVDHEYNLEYIQNVAEINYKYPELIANCIIATPTTMFRKEVFEQEGNLFNTDFKIGEDTCLWINISRFFTIYGLNNVLTTVNRDKNTTANDNYKTAKGIVNIMNFILSYKESSECYPYLYELSNYFNVYKTQWKLPKNIFIKVYYRIFLRPLLKMILGKSFIKKNKLDEKLG